VGGTFEVKALVAQHLGDEDERSEEVEPEEPSGVGAELHCRRAAQTGDLPRRVDPEQAAEGGAALGMTRAQHPPEPTAEATSRAGPHFADAHAAVAGVVEQPCVREGQGRLGPRLQFGDQAAHVGRIEKVVVGSEKCVVALRSPQEDVCVADETLSLHVPRHADCGVSGGELFADPRRAVRRGVIGDEDLQVRIVLGDERGEGGAEEPLGVPRRHHGDDPRRGVGCCAHGAATRVAASMAKIGAVVSLPVLTE
jgi:hypothetical protein